MKPLLTCVLLIFCIQTILAQEDAWVYFTDKQNVSASIANPKSILTQRAVNRKVAHNVTIDERDVPINENYITQIKAQPGIQVMAKSKWFNAIHVRGSQTDITALLDLSFVNTIEFANKSLNKGLRLAFSNKQKDKFETTNPSVDFNYGDALNQIEMFNGDVLHQLGYTGQGIIVAVMDAGFPNVNSMAAFQRMRDAGNLLGGYDFVSRTPISYNKHYHGTMVLSTMVGYIQDQYVGTAPDAQYYLFRTEDATSENPVEESYWVEAAERADSLGVDIVNTSLGYTTFDNPNYNYSTNDMNGATTFITRGANMAFEKGLLLINSAGNSGNDSWGIVGAPADSHGVLSVGAVDALGNLANFSSRGSTIQPTHKPDVVAQGAPSYVINPDNIIQIAGGTSFSSPILAGGIACLRQASTDLTNSEMMQLIRESASQYTTPDFNLGYGIPDLAKALNAYLRNNPKQNIKVFPNPVSDKLYVSFKGDSVLVEIYNVLGKKIKNGQLTKGENFMSVAELPKGMYFVKLETQSETKTVKIIKK